MWAWTKIITDALPLFFLEEFELLSVWELLRVWEIMGEWNDYYSDQVKEILR